MKNFNLKDYKFKKVIEEHAKTKYGLKNKYLEKLTDKEIEELEGVILHKMAEKGK